MDFDLYCSECCKKCDSPTNQMYESQIAGQGDCECNSEVTLEESVRKNFDRKKLLKEKDCWTKEKMEKSGDKKNCLLEKHCTCCRNAKESQGKTRLESNYDKCHLDLLEGCDSSWHQLLANDWTLNKVLNADNSNSRNSSPERLLRANFLHLEGKVNYLLQLFKDGCHKIPDDSPLEQCYAKTARPIYEGVFQLLSLNKRMCAAEEGIEKLTWTLEELLNEFRKKSENAAANDEWDCSLSSDLDETDLEQKIKSLLHRNDFLGKLMKTFLKVSLREKKAAKSQEEKPQQMTESSLQTEASPRSEERNLKEASSTIHIDRQSVKKSKYCTLSESQNLKKIDQKAGNEMNTSGNKLEVISELGEYSITPKLEREISELSKKLGIKNLKDFLISEEDGESGLEINSVPNAPINECFSNLSFEKCDTLLFPQIDPPKKNCLKIKLNQITDAGDREGSSDNEINVGILSHSPPSSGSKLKSTKLPSRILTKHSRLQDSKGSKKDVKNTSKLSSKLFKKLEEKTETKKNKLTPKIANKSSSTVGTPRQKSEYTPSGCCEQHLGICKSVVTVNQRPMTAPHAERKQLSTGGVSKSSSKNFLKPAIQLESAKKSTSTNVKSKNKNLQNKKSFIQAS